MMVDQCPRRLTENIRNVIFDILFVYVLHKSIQFIYYQMDNKLLDTELVHLESSLRKFVKEFRKYRDLNIRCRIGMRCN